MFSKRAKAFKPKGVKVELDLPASFNWSHESLPLGVELTNRAEEQITVESIKVQVREKQHDEEPGTNFWDASGVASYTHEGGAVLGAGETTRVAIEMPTSVEAAMGEEQSKWAKLAGKAIDAASQRKGGTNIFEVRALVYTEGSRNPKAATKTIAGGLQTRSSWGR